MTSRGSARVLAGALGLLLLVGCARIYRPMELAPARPASPAPGLAGALVLQPWGDNSRNEGKAKAARLHILVLGLENTSPEPVDILRLELPQGLSALPPGAAFTLVKLYAPGHLLWFLAPLLLLPMPAGGGATFGPSPGLILATGFLATGIVAGLPNFLVAWNSNRNLEAFLEAKAWRSGPLAPGEARRGLVFVQAEADEAPLQVQVIYRAAGREQSLSLACPGPAHR